MLQNEVGLRLTIIAPTSYTDIAMSSIETEVVKM